eukprot:1306229-Amphidinium_carterae.1
MDSRQTLSDMAVDYTSIWRQNPACDGATRRRLQEMETAEPQSHGNLCIGPLRRPPTHYELIALRLGRIRVCGPNSSYTLEEEPHQRSARCARLRWEM